MLSLNLPFFVHHAVYRAPVDWNKRCMHTVSVFIYFVQSFTIGDKLEVYWAIEWQNDEILITVLYTNFDLKLANKLHGPMHCKIGVTCVYIWHVFYNLLERKKPDNLIHLFQNSAVLVMNSRVFGQCSYTIHAFYIVLNCSNVNIHKA